MDSISGLLVFGITEVTEFAGFLVFYLIVFGLVMIIHMISGLTRNRKADCISARSCMEKLIGVIGRQVIQVAIEPRIRPANDCGVIVPYDPGKHTASFDGISWKNEDRINWLIFREDKSENDDEKPYYYIELKTGFSIPINSVISITPAESHRKWTICTEKGPVEFYIEDMSLVSGSNGFYEFDHFFTMDVLKGNREDAVSILTCDVQKLLLDYLNSLFYFSRVNTLREIRISKDGISIFTQVLTDIPAYVGLLNFEKDLSYCIMDKFYGKWKVDSVAV